MKHWDDILKHPRAKQAEGLGFPEPSALFSPEETEPVDLIGEIPEEKDDFSGIGEMEDLFRRQSFRKSFLPIRKQKLRRREKQLPEEAL